LKGKRRAAVVLVVMPRGRSRKGEKPQKREDAKTKTSGEGGGYVLEDCNRLRGSTIMLIDHDKKWT